MNQSEPGLSGPELEQSGEGLATVRDGIVGESPRPDQVVYRRPRHVDDGDRSSSEVPDPSDIHLPELQPAPTSLLPNSANSPVIDRRWPHVLWELLLVGAVLVSAWSLRRDHPGAFTVSEENDLWLAATVLTLLASGFAFTLRVGVPNLAIPAVAATSLLATYWLMTVQGWPTFAAVAAAISLAAVGGAILGGVIVVSRTPAWLASLGGAVLCVGVAAAIVDSLSVRRRADIADLPHAAEHGPWLFGLAAAVSIVGGALWWTRRVRDVWVLAAPPTQPQRLMVVLTSAVSTAMAALAGVLAGMVPESSLSLVGVTTADLVRIDEDTFTAPGQAVTLIGGSATGLLLPVCLASLALLAVIFGGVAAGGRGGGIFGTVLAVVLIVLWYPRAMENLSTAGRFFLAGAVAIVAVAVNRWMAPRVPPEVVRGDGLTSETGEPRKAETGSPSR